ncbi:MAG: hypothetical protein WA936_13365 [Erythrobacter sp.]|uniref:hypothetical protein n=1 Tax=Erythrobacter sp. TaxID=1042 RepID=UPI003C75FC16
MTGSINTGDAIANVGSSAGRGAGDAPAGWAELRRDPDIQFEPINIPPQIPNEPNAFELAMMALFGWLAELFAPVGGALGSVWPVLKWLLLGALVAFILVMLVRTIGPLSRRDRPRQTSTEEPDWQPDREQSLALLEDADRLAQAGQFAEAVRLLLHRSVGHIATARPDWVEPSSTARELSALPQLSEAARTAFATIAERVERSLFALRALERSDWESAREAYASFALARIDESSAGGARR